jgi:hypothetical protein
MTDTLVALFGGIASTVLLLMPGYLLGAVYSRQVHGPPLPDRSFIAASAVGGIAVHFLAFDWTVDLARKVVADGFAPHAYAIAYWCVGVLLVLPVILGLIISWLSDRTSPRWVHRVMSALGLATSIRTREAWNWVFRRQRSGTYVRVTTTENRHILGKFNTASFASSDATMRDIYIEELWLPDRDGWFDRPYPNTLGIWVSGSEIASIEFFEGQE